MYLSIYMFFNVKKKTLRITIENNNNNTKSKKSRYMEFTTLYADSK